MVVGACLCACALAVLAASSPALNGSIHGRLTAYPGRQPTGETRGIAVGGQQITLADSTGDHTIATTVTADDGSFLLTVPPGDYLLISSRSRKSVHVKAGQDVWVNLQQLGK